MDASNRRVQTLFYLFTTIFCLPPLPSTPAAGEARLTWRPTADNLIDARVIRSGHGGLPYIALTIDDGPHPAFVPRILKMLQQEGIKATFFVVGKMAKKYPELIKAEVAAGHEIGNHTDHHLSMPSLGREEIFRELEGVNEIVSNITGRPMTLFRPPGGRYDKRVIEIASEAGYRTVLWSVTTNDYGCYDSKAIADRMLNGARAGAIILCHSGVEATMTALPGVIRTLKARGYQFVTVSQLLELQIAHASAR